MHRQKQAKRPFYVENFYRFANSTIYFPANGQHKVTIGNRYLYVSLIKDAMHFFFIGLARFKLESSKFCVYHFSMHYYLGQAFELHFCDISFRRFDASQLKIRVAMSRDCIFDYRINKFTRRVAQFLTSSIFLKRNAGIHVRVIQLHASNVL